MKLPMKLSLLALVLSLATACGLPMKYQVYDLQPGHSDVIWVYLNGKLHRCWQHPIGAPMCMEAAVSGPIGASNGPPQYAPPPARQPPPGSPPPQF